MRLSNYPYLLAAAIVAGLCFFSLPSHAEVIKAGDALELSLRGVPETEQAKVNGVYRVRDNGFIRIPMVNVNIQAAGRKPEDLERSIEQAFKKAQIYVAPTVALEVKKNEKIDVRKVVVVGGEVKKPGRIQYREGMTLMEALQQAGGRDTFASKYLYLTRKDPKTGKPITRKLLYKDAKTKAKKIFPDDVLDVPVRGAIIDRG